MEKKKDFALSTPPPNRQSIKKQSHFNTYPLWKDKLRENCYKRIREDRNRLLWKMRLPIAKSLTDEEYMKSAFQDIVSEELKKIKHSSVDDHLKTLPSAPDVTVTDILWEYDGLHNAYEWECEEILLEMQRIFYEDMRLEPTRKETENYIETWEDEEDEYLARAVFELMKLNDEQVQKETWCPICKQGQLQENHQVIYCNLCELQLSKGDEVNLDVLHTHLAEAHTEHLDRGCVSKLKFSMETRFGITALYVSCEACKLFEVVL